MHNNALFTLAFYDWYYVRVTMYQNPNYAPGGAIGFDDVMKVMGKDLGGYINGSWSAYPIEEAVRRSDIQLLVNTVRDQLVLLKQQALDAGVTSIEIQDKNLLDVLKNPSWPVPYFAPGMTRKKNTLIIGDGQ